MCGILFTTNNKCIEGTFYNMNNSQKQQQHHSMLIEKPSNRLPVSRRSHLWEISRTDIYTDRR